MKVASAAALEGLPQDYIDRHKPAADGSIQITTDYPDILPAMRFVKSDALRRELFQAFQTRAYPEESRRAQADDADAIRDRDHAGLPSLGGLFRRR